MKSGVANSLKFKRLKRLLQQPDCMVAGVLEMVWGLAVDQARMGDVGRFTDDEIAAAIEWPGDATALVAALVESGWLDRNEVARLLVHDWLDHAPQFVTRWIARQLGTDGKDPEATKILWLARFGLGEICLARNGHAQDLASQNGVGELPRARRSIPFHSSQSSIDRLDRPTNAASYETQSVDAATWAEAVPDFKSASETLAKGRDPKGRNRETIVRGVLVARRYLPAGTLAGTLGVIGDKIRRDQIKQPFAYFRKSIIAACAAVGVDYHRAEAAFEIPEALAHPPPRAHA